MADEPASPENIPFDEQPTLRAGAEECSSHVPAAARTPGGTMLPATGLPIIGTIGDFEVVDKLGQGGMGAVYRARQVSLGRLVALKILPTQFEEDEDFVGRFQREARLAGSLNHPNLVRVYASGVADGSHFIAMELVEGETLSRRIKRGSMAMNEGIRVCLDVARALQCGWQRAQLIHRDIKPSNIYLSQSGEVKLGDLGLAKSLLGNTTGITHAGATMGTPHYISPEQARGDKAIDFRADIYSLGCTLFQCLTGRTPYEGTDPLSVINLHLSGPPPALLKVLPSCPIPLARLVGKMVKKQRHERHQSYEELIEQIESVLASLEAGPTDTGAEARLAMWREVSGGAAAILPSDPPLAVRSAPPVDRVARSKVPLFAVLAVLAVALAIGGVFFVVSTKKSTLTKAELYASDHAAESQSAADKPAPATIPAPSAQLVEPAVINLWNSPEKIPQKPGITWEDGAMRLEGKTDGFSAPGTGRLYYRDLEVRAAFRLNTDSISPQLSVRNTGTVATGQYAYAINFNRPGKKLELTATSAGQKRTILQSWPISRNLGSDEWLRVALRVVGDQITVSADGVVMGTVRDASVIDAGSVQAYATANGYFRDIEYIPLDGVAVSTPPAAEPWQDVLRDPSQWNLSGDAELTPKGLRFNLGSGKLSTKVRDFTDGSLRIQTTFEADAHPKLRARHSSSRHYELSVMSAGRIQLTRWQNAQFTVLLDSRLPRPLQPQESYQLELRVRGDILQGIFNGVSLGEVRDSTFQRGEFNVGTFRVENTPRLVPKLEFLDLSIAQTPDVPTRSAEPWQDLLKDLARLEMRWGSTVTPGGLRVTLTGGARLPAADAPKDGAIRIRSKFGAPRPQLRARWNSQGEAYQLHMGGDRGVLGRWDQTARRFSVLREFLVSKKFEAGQEYEMELRAVGQTLTVKLDGETLGAVTDSTLSEGSFGVGANGGEPALVTSFEFLDLSGNGTATVPKTPAPAKTGAPLVNSLEVLPPKSAQAVRLFSTPGEIPRRPTAQLADGVLRLDGDGHSSRFNGTDGAVRASVRMNPDASGPQIGLRANGEDRYFLAVHPREGRVALNVFEKVNVFSKEKPSSNTELGVWKLARSYGPDEWLRVELRAVGDRLTAFADGQELGSVQDQTITTAGKVTVYSQANGYFRDIEYLPLDAAPTPRGTGASAAATKDAPFVNSLGMKFIPVPITGGPTDGQRVLFSIWETRVQDYEASCQRDAKSSGVKVAGWTSAIPRSV